MLRVVDWKCYRDVLKENPDCRMNVRSKMSLTSTINLTVTACRFIPAFILTVKIFSPSRASEDVSRLASSVADIRFRQPAERLRLCAEAGPEGATTHPTAKSPRSR